MEQAAGSRRDTRGRASSGARRRMAVPARDLLDPDAPATCAAGPDARAPFDGPRSVGSVHGPGLALHFQPQADPRTGHITAAEAIARRQHRHDGAPRPVASVPPIAGHGAVRPLTLELLDKALAHARRWRAAGHRMRVAVDIAAPSLVDPSFPEGVADRLRAAGVGANMLQLEIAAQTVMADPAPAPAVLARLRAVGVRLALDDFGSDHASLARLTDLPFGEVKIAPEVVADVVGNGDVRAIVAAIIGLAKELDMHVVADGVGDAETWTMLAGMGCHRIQGSYLAPPMPAPALDRWLADDARLHGARALGTSPRALTVGILRGWPSPSLSSAIGSPSAVPDRPPPPGT